MAFSKMLGFAAIALLGAQSVTAKPVANDIATRPIPEFLDVTRTGLDILAPGDVRCLHIAPAYGDSALNATVTGAKAGIDILRKRTDKCGQRLNIAECGAVACSGSTTIWYCPRTVDDSKLQSCKVLADAIAEILTKCDTKTEAAQGYKYLVGANNTDGGSAFIDATSCDAPVHIANTNN